MEPQTALWILNAVIQGSIVILSITGVFITFILAFTWQHRDKCRALEGEKRELKKRAKSIIEEVRSDYEEKVRKIYESWFSQSPSNIKKFFDNLVFSHAFILRVRRYFLIYLFTSSIIGVALYVMARLRIISPRGPIAKRIEQIKILFQDREPTAALTIMMCLLFQAYDQAVVNKGSFISSISGGLFVTAIARALPPVWDLPHRREFVEIGRRKFEVVKEVDPGRHKAFRNDIVKWAVLHEFIDFFPNQFLFPLFFRSSLDEQLKIEKGKLPPKALKTYPEMDRTAFNKAKANCLAIQSRKELQEVKHTYEDSRLKSKEIGEQISQVEDAISELSPFVTSQGRKTLRTLSLWLVTFCVVGILWSFIIMSGTAGMSFIPKIYIYIAISLMMLAVIALIMLIIKVFLKNF